MSLAILFLTIVGLVAASVVLLTMASAPKVEEKARDWHDEKERTIEKKLDDMFSYDKSPRRIILLYYILPPVLGLVGYILASNWLGAFAGAFVGLAIPNMMLKIRDAQRRKKFYDQLIDSIMILSSALKGGLSLLQAFEVLVEEMPAPMGQEIGLLVRENRMGITLEESLRRLDKRMQMEDLSLVVNSVLVARETGGDLTKVFSRLITTIRDNRKLKESIKTLTLQGRLQGIIMSILPLIFFAWVIANNKHHFDIMLESDTGRTLLIVAVGLQIVGMVLIRKFSIIKI
ncbi:MAG: type II secretion system F family protein [Candidatus Omnitrophica bacterium]|nr:type II secretion system F family protein [Candidatus Omnitrophota bacterium]